MKMTKPKKSKPADPAPLRPEDDPHYELDSLLRIALFETWDPEVQRPTAAGDIVRASVTKRDFNGFVRRLGDKGQLFDVNMVCSIMHLYSGLKP